MTHPPYLLESSQKRKFSLPTFAKMIQTYCYLCKNYLKFSICLESLMTVQQFPMSLRVIRQNSESTQQVHIITIITSIENNLKTIINLQIPQLQSQNIMINEQYEEPTNPIKQLQKLKSVRNVHNNMNNIKMLNHNIEVSHSQFLIPCVEFYRICRQFSQVCQTFSISLQAQSGSNKKYMIFSGMTGNGIKTISLNQQRSQQEIEQSIISNNRLAIRQKFLTSTILKIAIFEENIRIILEREKSIFLVYYMKQEQGQVVFMSTSLPMYF